jgi:serine/threonine protein kinase
VVPVPDLKGPRYKIERDIGRGAFGVVYLAHDNLLRRNVALKVMSIPDGLTDEERQHLIDRFYREARAAAGLSHANIVIIHDISKAKDRHFISMELLEGEPLSRVIAGESMSVARALRVADQILAGLEYAHSREVIHRDIKPDNIFLLAGDGVKLVDFGLARVQASTTITQSGAVMGSPGYIAPEIIDGKAADKRTDVFSFGVVLYETLTGVRPFGPQTAFESFVRVIYRIMSEDPRTPSELNPAVPPELDAMIARMLAKDPDERYQDAGELREALAGLARELELPEETVPETRRKKEKTPKPSAAAPRVGSFASATVRAFSISPVAADATRTEILQFEQDLEREEGGEKKSRRKLVIGATAGGGTLVLAGLAVLLLFVFGAFQSSVVKVPYLVNLEKNVAVRTLKNAGLRAGKVEEFFAYEFARGRVSSQQPNAGTGVPLNSKVDLKVSMGNKVAAVPKEVIETPAEEARQTLRSFQFKVAQDNGYSTTVPVDCVIATKPAPGTVKAYGYTITMIVNDGKKPAGYVEPPPGSNQAPIQPLPGSTPVLPAPQP